MKEVDSLIESIKQAKPDLTEEALCIELQRNEGYISQLRSREKAEGKPQVSPKFMQALTQYNARLQKASDPNLAAIAQTLVTLQNGQALIQAELRGYAQYQIQEQVKWDQKKFLAAMAKVSMIVGANLKVEGDQRDSNGQERT